MQQFNFHADRLNAAIFQQYQISHSFKLIIFLNSIYFIHIDRQRVEEITKIKALLNSALVINYTYALEILLRVLC